MAVGKDEVPGSNLDSSSKIPLESIDSGGISLAFATFWAGLFLRFFDDSHRDPHSETSGEGQRVADRKLRLPAWLFALYDLRYKIPHRLCRSVLLLHGGVGVSAEREAGVVVPQHTADRFYVYPVLESQSRECVSEVVEADVLQPGVF